MFWDFDDILNFSASKNAYRRNPDTMGYLRTTSIYSDDLDRSFTVMYSAELVNKLRVLKQETGFQWWWLTTWTKSTRALDEALAVSSDRTIDWD
ncbi:hypothetical protein GCM10022198_23080 [Klugiella xanthotipulae]